MYQAKMQVQSRNWFKLVTVVFIIFLVGTAVFFYLKKSTPEDIGKTTDDPNISIIADLQTKLDKKDIEERNRVKREEQKDKVIKDLSKSVANLQVRQNRIRNAESKIDNSNSSDSDIIRSLNASSGYLVQAGYR